MSGVSRQAFLSVWRPEAGIPQCLMSEAGIPQCLVSEAGLLQCLVS